MFSSQLPGILGKCSQDADAWLTQVTSPPKIMEILCFHVNEHQGMVGGWLYLTHLSGCCSKFVILSIGLCLVVSVPPAGYPTCGKSV